MSRNIVLAADSENANVRLDIFISEAVEEISRSHAAKLCEEGRAVLSGKVLNKKYIVKPEDKIELEIPDAAESPIEAEDIPIDIVYEDDWLMVVNKPQGLVVHPGAGNRNGTLANALLNYCKGNLSGINGVMRPGIVHRIDKDTSGLLIVAKNDLAHMSLSEQLKDRTLSREYLALVNGNIKEDDGTVNLPIGRNPSDRKKMCVTSKNSRQAVTHFKVLERFGKYTLVSCKLQTGRTHQIRVHMAYMGHSVVGDKTYGIKKEEFNLAGQLLHARRIMFVHPKSGENMSFEAPIPDYFEKILEILRKRQH